MLSKSRKRLMQCLATVSPVLQSTLRHTCTCQALPARRGGQVSTTTRRATSARTLRTLAAIQLPLQLQLAGSTLRVAVGPVSRVRGDHARELTAHRDSVWIATVLQSNVCMRTRVRLRALNPRGSGSYQPRNHGNEGRELPIPFCIV